MDINPLPIVNTSPPQPPTTEKMLSKYNINIHSSGSWFEPTTHQENVKALYKYSDITVRVLCDWTTPEHTNKSKPDQWHAIVDAIKNCDVVLLSFEDMDERTHSATFAQFFIASAIKNKRIVVYDPAKLTRSNRNKHGFSVHPSFNHMMALPMYDDASFPNVAWIADKSEAFAKVLSFGTEVCDEKRKDAEQKQKQQL